jgi:hypothetical protein
LIYVNDAPDITDLQEVRKKFSLGRCREKRLRMDIWDYFKRDSIKLKRQIIQNSRQLPDAGGFEIAIQVFRDRWWAREGST